MPGLTYKDAGVDQAAKDAAIDQILSLMRRTHGPRVIDAPWGFAGLFSLTANQPLFRQNYRNPVLVACTDGVGTKLKIATAVGRHDTVGIDLVAMSVNDLVVTGGEPLFFLDYIATSKADRKQLLDIVRGIVAGCEQAGCALLGGETAEMPGMYAAGEYDLAGFAVGIVEKSRMIDGRKIRPGDAVIGLSSSGLHSNGYSLARKIVFERARLKVDETVRGLGTTVGEALLTPTRIYVKSVRDCCAHYRVKHAVKGIANITGGGMIENIPRILPEGCGVEIREGSWPVPPVFPWLEELGEVPREEMYRVFNMGIGLVIVADPFYAKVMVRRLNRHGERAQIIGKVVKGEKTVRVVGEG